MRFHHSPPFLNTMRLPARLLAPLFIAASLGHAAEQPGQQDSGKEVNGPCAACHGEFGQGGKRGEYPRIAGQRPAYLEQQLRNFRSRQRMNLPMFPYTQERELSDADIKAVSAYLAGIELPTKPPEFKDTDDALTRLLAMEKVMIIPRLEGDLENGKRNYDENCAHCHGKTGRGIGRFPMLVGQYTNYLQRQIDLYLKGERPHDQVTDEEEEDSKVQPADKPKVIKKGILDRLTEKDLNDILAHITHLQDATP
jgi:cytochrome c553